MAQSRQYIEFDGQLGWAQRQTEKARLRCESFITKSEREDLKPEYAREFGRVAERLESDSDASKRKALKMCKACYYIGRMSAAGQAFTDAECVFCEDVISHPNTNVPMLCVECADEAQLCQQCGGDRELRYRRSL